MTLSDCNQLAHVIVLWQIQNLCYCTIFALFYFVFEGNFQVQASRGLYSEGQFNRGFLVLRVWGRGGLFSEYYTPTNVNPVRGGGSAGKGWGFDKF